MQTGLILGKFMPFHYGHLELIKFASSKCEKLILLLCSNCDEPIPGMIRYNWLKDFFCENENIDVLHFYYRTEDLPNTFESSKENAFLWAQMLQIQFPDIDCYFSSVPNGNFLAKYMGIKSFIFVPDESKGAISATTIRSNPYKYWDFIPPIVKKYYYRKVCLVGTPSTCKSSLAVKLAQHYNSAYIIDTMGETVGFLKNCSIEELSKNAEEYASTIIEKDKELCKILFAVNDVMITKSYANYLFNKDIVFPDWIMSANRFDLYLFLESDGFDIQNKIHFSPEETIKLEESIRQELDFQQVFHFTIKGSLEEQFQRAKEIIDQEFITI